MHSNIACKVRNLSDALFLLDVILTLGLIKDIYFQNKYAYPSNITFDMFDSGEKLASIVTILSSEKIEL